MRTMQLEFRVAAKCNLSLSIDGIYENGYHLLDMCSASVDIWDRITLKLPDASASAVAASEPVIVCRMDGRPQDGRNSACIAADRYCRRYGLSDVEIEIVKGIPFCAGMGGSSADAAGVLRAMNECFGYASREELEALALSCGADVPYMLYGGFARVRGKGEQIERFEPQKHCALAVLKSDSVLTSQAYREYDLRTPVLSISADEVIKVVSAGRWRSLAQCGGNDLRPGAERLCESVTRNLELLRKFDALYADMTGSGSAVFGIFDTLAQAEAVARACKGKAENAFACMTLSHGFEILEKKS